MKKHKLYFPLKAEDGAEFIDKYISKSLGLEEGELKFLCCDPFFGKISLAIAEAVGELCDFCFTQMVDEGLIILTDDYLKLAEKLESESSPQNQKLKNQNSK